MSLGCTTRSPTVTAIILAGGQGSRLSESEPEPKPLVQVGDRSLIEHQLALFEQAPIGEIHVLVSHSDNAVAAAATNADARVRIHKDLFPNPGTATALSHVIPEIHTTLLVAFADTLTSMSLSRLVASHMLSGAALSMPVQPTGYQTESHMVELAGDRVVRLLGKPSGPDELPNLTFHPFFMVAESYVDLCRDRSGDFVNDVLPLFLNTSAGIHGMYEPELILDCGTPERLERARSLVKLGWLR